MFTNLTINTIGMFILQITSSSDDSQHNVNTTSNNIRVVSPNLLDDETYYNNLQMEFYGTFVEDDKAKYISMIYNYFLTRYGVELMGPIACYNGSVMFVSGLDQSNATLQAILSNGTIAENTEIIPGYSLKWFLLGNFEKNFTKSSISASLISTASKVWFLE